VAAVVEEGEAATPAKRGRGRPPGTTKPKEAGVTYRCRYGCKKHMTKNVNLRKHMMRVHGIFSNEHPLVYNCICGRRISPTWGELTCNKRDRMCKKLVPFSDDWHRHHVPEPLTEQEAADTFAYVSGVQPREMVIVLPHHNEEEQRAALAAALNGSWEQADAATQVAAVAEVLVAAAEAAVEAAQVNNEAPSAGSSQDRAIAIDDDEYDEEDAEFEVDDEYEQGPPAKRRRM
jgi:hypothetical protein